MSPSSGLSCSRAVVPGVDAHELAGFSQCVDGRGARPPGLLDHQPRPPVTLTWTSLPKNGVPKPPRT